MTQASFLPSALGLKPFGIFTSGYRSTRMVSLAMQPLASVAITVKVVFKVLEAAGFGAEGSLRKKPGVQVSVTGTSAVGLPPITTVENIGMITFGPASSPISGNTFTTTVSLAMQLDTLATVKSS